MRAHLGTLSICDDADGHSQALCCSCPLCPSQLPPAPHVLDVTTTYRSISTTKHAVRGATPKCSTSLVSARSEYSTNLIQSKSRIAV
jgi:hypothetical protein